MISLAKAILASSRAKRMPRQDRGPDPNGIQAIGCLFFFNSGSNLHNRKFQKIGSKKENRKNVEEFVPIGIESIRIWPHIRIVVDLPDRNLNISSGRNTVGTQLGVFGRFSRHKQNDGRVKSQDFGKDLIEVGQLADGVVIGFGIAGTFLQFPSNYKKC